MLIKQVVKNNKWNIQKDTYLYASISLWTLFFFLPQHFQTYCNCLNFFYYFQKKNSHKEERLSSYLKYYSLIQYGFLVGYLK